MSQELKDYLLLHFDTYVQKGINEMRKLGPEPIATVNNQLVFSMLSLIKSHCKESLEIFKDPNTEI